MFITAVCVIFWMRYNIDKPHACATSMADLGEGPERGHAPLNLGEKISQKEEKPAGQANSPPPTKLTQFYFKITFMHEIIKPA